MASAKGIMSSDRKPDRTAKAADLGYYPVILEIAHSGPTVFLGDENTHQTEFPHLVLEKVDRELLFLVPFHQLGFDLLLTQVLDHILDHTLVLAHVEVHGQLVLLRDIFSFHRVRIELVQ